MSASVLDSPTAAPARWRLTPRRLALLVIVLALAPFAYEAGHVMFGFNFHTVVPGRIYRCCQPSPEQLERLIADQGVRTIVNLRGPCDSFEWYLDEARIAHDHNVCLEDISFSAGRLPPVAEVRRLIEVLDHTAYPIVVHCRRGADRTGLAATIAVLLTADVSLEDACTQLGLRYGHIALGRPGQLDQFFAFYKKWLTAQGKMHSKELFRQWALNHYCPGACWAEIAFNQPPPSHVASGQPAALHLRVCNASMLSWTFTPQWTAGVHLGCHVFDEQDQLIDVVKAGLRDAVVKPGESIDFTLSIPALYRPGRYRLQIDMLDERQCWFFQTGSQPLEWELIVRE
ncbi:MAG TPA: tyrosine-protein phosphatase [Gemmataceae bacterium]|nr:tyrosine-protein phosphatase [Gemmataceae bacterium]